MVIQFSGGKIIVTPHEVVVRLGHENRVTLQAQAEAITLMGKGACDVKSYEALFTA
ncbi:DUF3389 family protein, partial [Vibrio cholerae]